MNHRLARAAGAALALALWAGPAGAQLDLPDHPAPAAGEPGVELPRKVTGDLAPRRGDGGIDVERAVDLDVGPAPAPAAEVPGPAGPALGLTPGSAVALDELARVEDPRDPRIDAAVARLSAEGAQGLAAARAALAGTRVGPVITGARVLLAAGEPGDHERVIARLSAQLPSRAITPLFQMVADSDPVRVPPELWIGLLEHDQASAREAAARHLAGRVRPEDVPEIAARLRSSSADTRRLAVELLAGVADPSATRLLLDRLGDPSAKVAGQAARILSLDPSAEAAIVAAAFPDDGLVDRAASYARLAVAEREDRVPTTLVGEDRVPALMSELAHEDPLRRGAAAILLAGIGFRAEGSRGYRWLDREVPHELVRMVSGEEFHRDFASLVEPARRRIALLSGEAFGANGGAWRAWWIDAFSTFRAHRAVIEVGPAEQASLVVRYRGAAPESLALRFLGPDAPPDEPGAPVLGRTVLLDAAEASDLARRLADEGVFSARRLPSPSVAFTTSARELEVQVGEQGKRFVLPASTPEGGDPWLERLAHTFRAVDEEHRWQRYPAGLDPRAFEAAEGAWWHAPRSEAERDQRLKQLVLADLARRSAFERGPGVQELERLAARGALAPEDFEPLLELCAGERFHGERVSRLAALARAAVRDAGGRLASEPAWRLIELLGAAFPGEAAGDVAAVLAESDPELTRRAARDERPVLRALAAAGLARRGGEEDLLLLQGLLRDPVADVEAACVLALAEAGRTELGDELLYRARIADPRVRAAALRAVGVLRLEGASDVLVKGLTDDSQAVQLAAVEGLADLRDPGSAGLLVSVLARGSGSPYFAAAERGLRALGADAHEALARAAQAPAGAARRDAAILLAQGLSPQAVAPLIAILRDDPSDGRVASELAVLSAVDYRDLPDPHAAWSTWWKGAVSDDPLAWFRAGCERVGLRAPAAPALDGAGTPEGRAFLLEVLARPENHLVERARRELGRMLGGDLGPLPARGALRDEWIADLRARALD